MLHINNLTYRIAGRPLFEGATAHVPAGSRVGLVGHNGSGKTTLLRLIQGEIESEGGSTTVRNRARIAAVSQEAPGGPQSLLDFVLAADLERTALLDEAETAHDPGRIADIHHRLADISAHSAPARAGSILSGLGFDAVAQSRPLSEYSGGWRMRVALAAVLFSEPDLLLLDEPTNHLDLEAALWLENYLKSYAFTVVIVSHDRDLLNVAVNRILHLDKGKLTLYTGGYDDFERLRRERLIIQSKMHARQQAQMRHMEAFVERFRYKATKARQAQSRLKALERMQPIAAVIEDKATEIHFPNPLRASPPLISLDNVSAGYEPGNPVLSDLNLRLDPEDRVALLGANGNGKSTLARIIAGRLKPETGARRAHRKLEVGFFAQHQLEELTPGHTPIQHLAEYMEGAPEQKVRTRLGSFGFGVEKALTPVEKLSGGEKARLLLALASFAAPHVLILDEPTNHLDVDAREALIQAINAYEGAVLLISHDRHLIETCVDHLWLVENGTVAPYEGNVEDYRRAALSARGAGRASNGERSKNNDAANGNGSANNSREARKDARRDAAAARQAVSGLKKAVQTAEKKVEKLTLEMEQLTVLLANPDLYGDDHRELNSLMLRKGQLEKKLKSAEEGWIKAEEVYDAASSVEVS
jgi:ATP-binding cassette subfamily F protein 3